jgi:lipoyl(octanoyl) transferase
VYTVGKRCTTHNLIAGPEALRALGAELHVTQRGGDVTFHGPGQLVGYPIVHVRRLGCGARAYVEGLEDALCAAAADFGVAAVGRMPGAPGVWVAGGERKLGAVGVRISSGVASHGFALNVSTDLSYFRHIVPCGIKDKVRVAAPSDGAGWAAVLRGCSIGW